MSEFTCWFPLNSKSKNNYIIHIYICDEVIKNGDGNESSSTLAATLIIL